MLYIDVFGDFLILWEIGVHIIELDSRIVYISSLFSHMVVFLLPIGSRLCLLWPCCSRKIYLTI